MKIKKDLKYVLFQYLLRIIKNNQKVINKLIQLIFSTS